MSTADRARCLPDTRLDIRPSVAEWASNPDGRNVLWISGPVGSGKSTVATSLYDFFMDISYLGAFLFFDSKSRYEPAILVSTLAHQLSHYDQRIRETIVSAVKLSEGTLRARLQVQFDTFVFKPLQNAKLDLHHPILIIIDGLDHCGDADSRRQLLEIFSNLPPSLRGLLRIVITSQPDPDVGDLLENFDTMELDTTSEVNQNDIRLYFEHEFEKLRKQKPRLGPKWPGADRLSSLVERAGGLFLWSFVAAKHITPRNSDSRLDNLLKAPMENVRLDDIYSESLGTIDGWDDDEFVSEFKAVVGMIIVAGEPLSFETIDALRGSEAQIPADETIPLLGSVLIFPTSISPHVPVRTLHSSFDDYLCDRQRCDEKWHIDIALHHETLALNCISYLSRYFGVADSANMSIGQPQDGSTPEDFLQKLREEELSIEALTYAATFWPHHFCAVKEAHAEDTPILKSMDNFLRNNLLDWFELLSILKRSREASRMLKSVSRRLVSFSPISLL